MPYLMIHSPRILIISSESTSSNTLNVRSMVITTTL